MEENKEILENESNVRNENNEIIKYDEKQANELLKINQMTEKGTKIDIETTLTDELDIFNASEDCDYKLNDCKGQEIVVTNCLIKRIEKDLPENEIEIDEETGQIIKDKDIQLLTILIDENNETYVTASKIFGFKFLRFVQTIGVDRLKEGVRIKITERDVKDSPNKALSFKVIK